MIDVLVIGAGPSGATAARLLAASGHDVILVDRHQFPRDKVCGDGLIPDALSALRRAGLYEQVAELGHHCNTLSVYSASGIQVDIPGSFVTLRRRLLDHLLVQAAVSAGADFRIGKITELREDLDGVTAHAAGSQDEIRARIVVLATGADTSLSTHAFPGSPTRPNAVAARCYVRSPVAVERLVISFDRTIAPGYAWIFPLGNHEYNIGCGYFYGRDRGGRPNLRRTFEAFIRHFPTAIALWEARKDATKLAGAPLRCGLDSQMAYRGGRTLAIGETIGTTYPFTGEGVGKAIETAEIAAEQITVAMKANDHTLLANFPQLLRDRLAPKYAGYRVAENWLARAWLGDLVASRVRRSATLQQTAADVVNETASPKDLFSWKRLLPRMIPWR